ncbi:MAG TPA: LysR substrate-binding domain-containing protein [Chthoniobacterales bacterium]|nr:LysR substrate-binding domain-containing protein [Chthoniobacterales bacterium]
MELRHLRYFVAVAEELNFARAARRVHIAQPSLTKQIQQLEQELGFPLLYRTKKKVELLDTGRVLLEEAQGLLRQAEKAIQSTRRTHTGESGRLVIGFSPSAAPEVLPRILRRYHALYPNVVVDLLEITNPKNAETLLESLMSVAVVRSPSFLTSELFCFEIIQRERFVVALPDSHRLAKQDSIRIKALASEPLIVPPLQPGWGYSEAIFQIFRDNGIEPRTTEEATQALAVITLVAGGFGVALVPVSISNLRLPGVTYRPIKGRCRTSDLTLVWRRDSRASTVRAFLEVVKGEYPGGARS